MHFSNLSLSYSNRHTDNLQLHSVHKSQLSLVIFTFTMITNTRRQMLTQLVFIAVCFLTSARLPFGVAARSGRSSELFNPQYDGIGRAFVVQYYSLLDNSDTRGTLDTLYHPSDSLMTYEGNLFQGATSIGDKFKSLSQNLQHSISSIDTQPMFDGGVLVIVSGVFKEGDDDSGRKYSQTFVLKPSADSYFAQHDIFRLET